VLVTQGYLNWQKLDTNVKIPKKNVENKLKSKDKSTGNQNLLICFSTTLNVFFG
jgi:hypothetical protein